MSQFKLTLTINLLQAASEPADCCGYIDTRAGGSSAEVCRGETAVLKDETSDKGQRETSTRLGRTHRYCGKCVLQGKLPLTNSQ